MGKMKRVVKRHTISSIFALIICVVLLVIAFLIDASNDTGPMSDMAGVALCYGGPILCGLSLVPMILIASLGEMARYYLENRLKWYLSTPIFVAAIFGLSFLAVYLFWYKDYPFIPAFALEISLPVSIYACTYWLILMYSNDLLGQDQ